MIHYSNIFVHDFMLMQNSVGEKSKCKEDGGSTTISCKVCMAVCLVA